MAQNELTKACDVLKWSLVRYERGAIAGVASKAGVTFRGLFLTADLATRIARVGARTGDASDADAEVARKQAEYDLGRMDWTEVDTSGTPDETLARARAQMAH